MTKAELQAALDAAGIEYPSNAKNAELEQLLNDSADPGTAVSPGSAGTIAALHRADEPVPLIRNLARLRAQTGRR
jgi:hypothetical protein